MQIQNPNISISIVVTATADWSSPSSLSLVEACTSFIKGKDSMSHSETATFMSNGTSPGSPTGCDENESMASALGALGAAFEA